MPAARIGLVLLVAAVLTGCAVSSTSNLEPVSNQTLVYYPGLVKGFERTYPARRIMVLAVVDNCEAGGRPDPAVSGAGQEVGETRDAHGRILQHLYTASIVSVVQKAIEDAAQEAGMTPMASSDTAYTGQDATTADYVLQSKLTRCWVKKQRVSDANRVESWQTIANFAIDAVIYKPPFRVPFWQASVSETYSDPPDVVTTAADDQASIYDEPGEVLSVAFTRSVEGIFKRSDLHTLITEDRALRR